MMITSEAFWQPIRLSLEVASVALIVVLIVGVSIAKIMAHKSFPGRTILDTLLLLPLVLPPSVVGFLLIVLFGRNSVIGQMFYFLFDQSLIFTWWAAMLAAMVVAFPLMYLSAKSGFESIDRDVEDASRVDGANEWRVLLLVTIPLASRAIITGAILSFARALGEFGATLMFAGNIPGRTQTVPTAIYVAMDSGNMSLAWLWVIMLLLISFTVLFSINFIRSRF